jgi:hypothetical protein
MHFLAVLGNAQAALDVVIDVPMTRKETAMTITETVARMEALPRPPSGPLGRHLHVVRSGNSPEPHVADKYEIGAILEYSWGYDQTNIDYFMVTKRTDSPKGATFLTLIPMRSKIVEQTGYMQGTSVPSEPEFDAKPIRRKLHKWDGTEHGVSIRSYGWCGLWDGKPSHWTAYA